MSVSEVESKLMSESMEIRRKRDALFELILPSAENISNGKYEKLLNSYCSSILSMYEQRYECNEGVKIPSWIKDSFKTIIASREFLRKLAIIFFTLSKEQDFADHFVPRPQIITDSHGNPIQAAGTPKVDPSKFRAYMLDCLIPLTKQYLNGQNEMNIEKYVNEASLGWMQAPTKLSIEAQLERLK